MKIKLILHNRELTLYRFPKRNNETLQAWDAGDEYLIDYMKEKDVKPGSKILVINDSFGALSCWFAPRYQVTVMTDSYIAKRATENNIEHNELPELPILTTMDSVPADTDIVLLKIPKSNRHLIWILSQLRQRVTENCEIIAVNKARDIHTSTLNLFSQYLGTTTTSLAKKKHRLVFSKPDAQQREIISPVTSWDVKEQGFTLHNWPNTYSGEKLDLGARFMLQYLPQDKALQQIIDLGCGNGILSLKIAQLNPQAHITCVDESFMALRSAEENLQQNLHRKDNITYVANNCLDGFTQGSSDLIICNPPFHQQQAVTDHIAWQMFCDAQKVLCNGGKLLVVGNRHLGYRQKLQRLFGQKSVKLVAENNKFVILQATNNRAPCNH